MRMIRALGLGAALLAGSAGITRAQNAGGINYFELFQQLDANSDRVIDRGEIPESGQAAFDQLVKNADSNKDGRIDIEEYRQMLGSLRDAFGALGPRFATIDKNGDGKISKDEFSGPQLMFRRADADGDGVITKDEADKFQPGLGPGPGLGAGPAAAAFAQRVRAMDKDGDGKVSKDEFTGPPQAFDRLDANQDGFVTMQEASRMMRPGGVRPGAGPMGEGLRAMDKNKDGKISRDEFTGPPPLFDRLDRNSDGFISADELPAGPPGKANAKGARRRFLVQKE
jgi:Ca2+-binding EF-hand superfamily protein